MDKPVLKATEVPKTSKKPKPQRMGVLTLWKTFCHWCKNGGTAYKLRLSEKQIQMIRYIKQFAVRLTVFCIIALILMQLVFAFAKEPAYISFSSAAEEANRLSNLHSQCIRITADEIKADISQHRFLETTIAAGAMHLSSDALDAWANEYLEKNGVSDCEDIYLAIQCSGKQGEIKLAYEYPESGAGSAAIRYDIGSSSSTDIDSQMLGGFSSSAKSVTIIPCLVSGEGYDSFSGTACHIQISIPKDTGATLLLVYKDSLGKQGHREISPSALPDYSNAEGSAIWSFGLNDSLLQVSSGHDGEITLNVSGQYVLDLWSTGISRIYTYLSGALSFHYAAAPQVYALKDQLVEVSGDKGSMNMALRKGIRVDCEENLVFNGAAARMNISGFDPFPNLKMWIRENIYVAPVSLLSVMISMYKLPFEERKKKDNPAL